MSLIQQALKRKLDEQQGRSVAPPPPLTDAPIADVPPPLPPEGRPHPRMTFSPQGSTPDTSGSAPPPGPAVADQVSTAPAAPQHIEAPPPRKGPRVAAVLLFLVAVLTGAAVLYFGRSLFEKARPRALADEASPAVIAEARKQTPVAVGPATDGAAPAAPVAHPQTPSWVPLPNVGDVHARVDKMKDGVAEVRTQADAVLTDAAASGTKPTAATPAAPGPAAPVQAAVPTAPPARVPATVPKPPEVAAGDVVWPAVRLSGVMARGNKGDKTALLNDTVLGVGESVDGLTVVEVQDNGVLLEYKGARQFFPLGRRR